MAIIKDAGTGKAVAVSDDNRLQTDAITQDIAQSLNVDGAVFTAYAEPIPSAQGNYFFYLKNTGTSNIAIANLNISATVATRIDLEAVSGTPVFTAEGDAQIINNNIGSANPLLAEVKYDTNITGLASLGTFCFAEIPLANTKYREEISSGIIIPQGKAVALRCVGNAGTITISVRVGII